MQNFATASEGRKAGRLRVVEGAAAFDYRQAFCRNLGLVSAAEQDRLRDCCVAIAGLGGVGGSHLATLARLGVGRFKIADPDHFELQNFNRQFGATLHTLGRNKCDAMIAWLRGINPDARISVYRAGIDEANVEEFLDGADVVLDGLDFFLPQLRRTYFRAAAAQGRHVVTAGPIGFSAALLVFAPDGMSFDDYFDLHDDQSHFQQLIRFAVGLTPRATQLSYLDRSRVSLSEGRGPSSTVAAELCAGVAATEVLRILLERGPVKAVPHYCQFDPYRRIYKLGYMPWGNRNPVQRAKIWFFGRRFR
jgi:molybdopterin/thiamine biosynthesis adenylyltransferase